MDHETIRRLADLSIRRGCGFVLLGTACIMVGFAHDFAASIKAAAVVVGMAGIVMLGKGMNAQRRPYRDTELWLLLEPRPAPSDPVVQRKIGQVLTERYYWHARIAGYVASALMAFWGLLKVTGW